jgi:hypothetical protein
MNAVGNVLGCVGTLMLVVLGACGGEPTRDKVDDDDSSNPTENKVGAIAPTIESGPAAQPVEIGRLSVSDTTIVFYSSTLDGHTNIGMRETGSAYAKSAVVAPLMAQKLTTLEIYLALAPPGTSAPPALVEAQAGEAAAMGRSAEVRQVTVDASTLVEKDLTACESTILDRVPPDGNEFVWDAVFGIRITNNQATEWFYPARWICSATQSTAGWVILGTCNEGPDTEGIWLGYGLYDPNEGGCADYSINGNGQDVPPGHYDFYYWQNTNGVNYEIDTLPEGSGSSVYDDVIGIEAFEGQ